MTFAIIDSEGATVATAENATEARAFVRASLRNDPAARDDLAVVEYDGGGRRVGDAAFVGDFLRQSDQIAATLRRLIAEEGMATAVQLADATTISTETVMAAAMAVRTHRDELDPADLVAAIRRDSRPLIAA
jgi:hypothetical protein